MPEIQAESLACSKPGYIGLAATGEFDQYDDEFTIKQYQEEGIYKILARDGE